MDYLRRTPSVRDVVVSGGDVANMPWPRLEAFVDRLLEIDTIRDIRLATKALMGLPQHWLQAEVRRGRGRGAAHRPPPRGQPGDPHPRQRGAVGDSAGRRGGAAMLEAGVRDVRNQGVLMRGVNAAADDLLDLCFALQDEAHDHAVLLLHVRHDPRTASTGGCRCGRRRSCSTAIMGYLPGFATPRIVCDVPYRRQALGAPGGATTTGTWASRTGRRTTARRSRSATPMR